MKKAVIVLSGGLDSATCMGIAKEKGYELYPITFHYRQKHDREVEQAKKIAHFYDVKEHRLVDISFFAELGGSALTDESMAVPKASDNEQVPTTYVPARNMIFLALASAYAEVIGAQLIYIGVSSVDFSGYPDCRPQFIASMNETANLALQKRVTIEAPLSHLSKKETVELGIKLGVPYELTTSCYNGGEKACGICDSCLLRLKGFQEAGMRDPIEYELNVNNR